MSVQNENVIDIYLESRLQEWAEWLRTGNFLNIGYQRQSSIAMFAEGKSINQTRKSKMTVDVNLQAEEIEKMISEMAQYKSIMADCLRYHYLHQQSLRKSAKKLGILHMQYKLHVQMAKQWLGFCFRQHRNARVFCK